MPINLSTILNVASTIFSPKQALSKALSILAGKNPNAANMIQGMIKSGKNPADAMREFAQQGQIDANQLGQIKDIYKKLKLMGFKNFSVPDNVWQEAEQALNSKINPRRF